MRVVINKCHGGFSVSEAVYQYLMVEKGWEIGNQIDEHKGAFFGDHSFKGIDSIKLRSNPDLVDAVEKVGLEEASGQFSKLSIVEVPDDAIVEIGEYDGMEWIQEQPHCASGVLPDGSGDYHVDEFDSKQEAVNYWEAARSVSSMGHAKKIRCLEYAEVVVERTGKESIFKKDGI